jgi:hypothetical protein
VSVLGNKGLPGTVDTREKLESDSTVCKWNKEYAQNLVKFVEFLFHAELSFMLALGHGDNLQAHVNSHTVKKNLKS